MEAQIAPRKVSRKEQRKREREKEKQQKTSLDLKLISPLTSNQRKVFEFFDKGKHLMLHGVAGSGKTFLSMFLALQAISDGDYKKLVIVRSVVPTRDMGFLPGNQREKMRVYEAPYIAICTELFGRSDAYEILRQRGMIEFISTSFIRGTTLTDAIVLVDEIQNLTSHEADSIITRAGKNARFIFSGDIRQSDLNKRNEVSGLYDFMKIIHRMKSFATVEFVISDICRSSLVRDYIITRNELEDIGEISNLSRT